jgi:hypothetical protein
MARRDVGRVVLPAPLVGYLPVAIVADWLSDP